MGPPRVIGGYGRREPFRPTSSCRFNGAAESNRRIPGSARPPEATPSRFNGAAESNRRIP